MKRLVVVATVLLMVLGVVGLTGCNFSSASLLGTTATKGEEEDVILRASKVSWEKPSIAKSLAQTATSFSLVGVDPMLGIVSTCVSGGRDMLGIGRPEETDLLEVILPKDTEYMKVVGSDENPTFKSIEVWRKKPPTE